MHCSNGARHRLLERLDADAHLIAVLNPVVDIEAVNGGGNQTAKDPQRSAVWRFTTIERCGLVRTMHDEAVIRFGTPPGAGDDMAQRPARQISGSTNRRRARSDASVSGA